MDDSQEVEARTPHPSRFVTELEMLTQLDRLLWEVERKRAEEGGADKG